MKQLTSKQKNYISLSIVFLLLGVYVIFFPFISNFIAKWIPNFGKCPYLSITGHPCPLCGGTRYIANLPTTFHNPAYLLNPFGIICIGILLEIFFRIFAIFYTLNHTNIKKLIISDFLLHVFYLLCFGFYEICFLLFT